MNPAAAQEPTLTKITAKILPSVYWAFTRQVRDALLLRDAFLDRVIANEISHIKLDCPFQRLIASPRLPINLGDLQKTPRAG